MNSKEILDALQKARSFKTEQQKPTPQQPPLRNDTSFVSVYDQLEQLDRNPFSDPFGK